MSSCSLPSLAAAAMGQGNGCESGSFACAAAAEALRLDVLQWAHENRCPWDTWTCSLAASGLHCELLQCALEQGCPWHKDVYEKSMRRGHTNIVQWLMGSEQDSF
jgi:hypothetical protein